MRTWQAWVAVCILSALAIACLFDAEGNLRLKVEASLQGLSETETVNPLRPAEELVALVEVPDRWRRSDVEAVIAIERKLRRLAGVISVETAFSVAVPQTFNNQIETRPLYQRLRLMPDQSGPLIEAVLTDPLIAGRLVDETGRGIAIRVITKSSSEAEAVLRRQAVRELIQTGLYNHPRFDGLVTGMPLIEASISRQIALDLQNVLLISLLIIPLLLFLAFSGMAAILLPLISIFLSLLWTMGLMAVLEIPVNLVTSIIPPLVIALTLAYAMHALFAFSESVIVPDDRRNVVSQLLFPFLLTGLTTVAGFLALYLQPMQTIREFSLAGTMGVVCSLISVVLVHCYAGRQLLARIRPRRWLTATLMPLAHLSYLLATQRRQWVIGIALAVILMGAYGSTRIEPGARYVSDLPDDHPVRVDFDRISEAFGGGNSFDIIFSGSGPDAVLLPATLNAVDQFQNWLMKQRGIGSTTSLVDYIKRLNQAFTTGQREDFRLPDDMAFTKQVLLLAGSTEAQRYTNYEHSKLVIRINTSLDDVESMRRLFGRIERKLAKMPPGLHAELSGSAVSLADSVAKLTSGQVTSFGLALLAIYLVISAVFASLRMGVRAMLPNLFPIAVYYGLIGFMGIELSPTMALVACIVLGIAVDDTLFYLVRFNKEARALASEKKAAAVTLNEVIRPVTMTTVVLCLCFMSMVNSEFGSTVTFAVLASVTLMAAWVSDLTLTPAIGARSAIVTLWDVLTLDLGESPEKTIPLFKDMSARQARLFALLSHAREVPAGERFIRVGDAADDMYIVIAGEGSAWLGEDDNMVELARFRRGDLFGEVGGFVHHRTANVSAVTDLKLLAFNFKTLERLRQRYPRIASLVYRNLNQAQAERLEKTNMRLNLTGAGKTG